jgi:hypothetical protein
MPYPLLQVRQDHMASPTAPRTPIIDCEGRAEFAICLFTLHPISQRKFGLIINVFFFIRFRPRRRYCRN